MKPARVWARNYLINKTRKIASEPVYLLSFIHNEYREPFTSVALEDFQFRDGSFIKWFFMNILSRHILNKMMRPLFSFNQEKSTTQDK